VWLTGCVTDRMACDAVWLTGFVEILYYLLHIKATLNYTKHPEVSKAV